MRRRNIHPVATGIRAAVLIATSTDVLFVVAVRIRLVANTAIPRLVGIEGSKASSSAGAGTVGLLVGSCGGAIVAVLKLADLIVEPADDTAGRWLRWTVWSVLFVPW